MTMKLRAGRLVEAEVEDLDDVGVHEPRGGQRLAAEARHEARVLGQVLGEQLDRDVALQAGVERELDGRHAADAEAVVEPVAVGEELRRSLALRCTDTAAAGRFHRRRSGPGSRWASGVGVSVGSGVGVSVGVGVGVGGGRLRRRGGRRRGLLLGLAVAVEPALDVVEPRGEVVLERLARAPRQLAHLLVRGHDRGASPSPGPRRRRRSSISSIVDVSALARVWEMSSGSSLPQPARGMTASNSPSRSGRRGMRRLRLAARDAGNAAYNPSLTVLEALGERVGQVRRPDRGLGARDVVLRAAVGRRPAAGVEQQPRGARVAVARLADRARVDQPLGPSRGRARSPSLRRGRPWPARPPGGRRRARRASGRSARRGSRWRRSTARRSGRRARTPRSGRAGRRGRARRPRRCPRARARAGTRASRA